MITTSIDPIRLREVMGRHQWFPATAFGPDGHAAVWGESGWAYQCFAPAVDHVNIHEHALHLWGLLSGEPLLPNFGASGSI